MSGELATIPGTRVPELAVSTSPQERFTPDQVDLIKRTVCKGGTDDELALFMHVCRRTGLDPLVRQIYAVKRWDKNAGREVMSTQTGIDGFRVVAERTGRYEGQDGPYFCGEDGVWVDVWLKKTPPIAAKVGVFKRGFRQALYRVAKWDEYAQRGKDGLTKFWANMPCGQLAKCAESLALRSAFPQDLSGIYTSEEMDQAGAEERGSAEAAQAVAQEKIAAMQAKAGITPAIKEPGPAPIIDATLDPDPPTLHDDIAAHPPKAAAKKPYDKFAMYAALEGLKKRFVALGAEPEYRRILGLYGATKRTELPTKDGGTQARAAYKEMSLRVADLEIIPEVEKLPDPVEIVAGTPIRCGGKVWTVTDTEDGYQWTSQMPLGGAV